MAAKKNVTKTSTSKKPTIKSSHGKPLGDRTAPRSAKAPRGRAGAPSASTARAKPALRKPRAASKAPASLREPAARSKRPKTLERSASSESVASDGARKLAVLVATSAIEKKAVGIEIVDVAGRVDYADFLVIMTGRSDRHVQALASSIEADLKKQGSRPLAIEGLPLGSWVLMDYADVVVHIFQEETRSLYDLDGLWLDARRIPSPIPDELRTSLS